MRDEDRSARNRERLQQCHPVFRQIVVRIITTLQEQGFRPRIQDAWRSPEDQEQAYFSGHSKLQWGFHNATTPDGRADALAVDLLDDDHPLNPARDYLLALAAAAKQYGATTGIAWGLPPNVRNALTVAITTGGKWEKAIGWDPTHVEMAGLSVADAKRGVRPSDTPGQKA